MNSSEVDCCKKHIEIFKKYKDYYSRRPRTIPNYKLLLFNNTNLSKDVINLIMAYLKPFIGYIEFYLTNF